jgi:demethylmenaquinone methyltransferase/2-methoxy-6-polyprenyl-1,4-benzoquinol methylase
MEDYTKKDSLKTKFGFRTVSFEEKKSLVQNLFSSVATKYDLMNDVMSLGVHRLWKQHFVNKITNFNSKILDMAGGTGDISMRIIRKALMREQNVEIVICDINYDMLHLAKDRAIDLNYFNHIKFMNCDAENLPFADNSFDYYTISFGIRNVANISKALKEAYRVLKPAGRFLCLEFSKIPNEYVESVYKSYSFNIIPWIGKHITGDEEAYRYLVESIDTFPDQNNFKAQIIEAGFSQVEYSNLTSGVAAIHSGYKI